MSNRNGHCRLQKTVVHIPGMITILFLFIVLGLISGVKAGGPWYVSLAGIAISGGNSAEGGGIYNEGALALETPEYTYTIWLPLTVKDNTNPIHQGIATYYNATGAGACSFAPSPGDLMVAAMNAEEYNNAAVCGAYVKVTGPQGTVTVRIVDLCPGCKAGHLDLSREAFEQIAELAQGRVDITWQVVSPPLTTPIAYHFKDGSNQWWTAVQVRDHRNPIAKLEYLSNDQWVNVTRTSYNYFVQTNPGMGPGPYTFRVTDSYGNELLDSDIPHIENGTVNGASQFPVGP